MSRVLNRAALFIGTAFGLTNCQLPENVQYKNATVTPDGVVTMVTSKDTAALSPADTARYQMVSVTAYDSLSDAGSPGIAALSLRNSNNDEPFSTIDFYNPDGMGAEKIMQEPDNKAFVEFKTNLLKAAENLEHKTGQEYGPVSATRLEGQNGGRTEYYLLKLKR